MAENKTVMHHEERSYRVMYYGFFFPLIFGGGAFAFSDLSLVFGWIWGTIMLSTGIWTIVSYVRKRHLDPKWRPYYFVINLDLAALFALCPFWFVFGKPVWLGLLLLCLFGVCVFVSHRFRHVVATGLLFEGGTRGKKFGKWCFGVIGAIEGLTAGGSYGFARTLQVTAGYSTASVMITSCLVPIALVIAMFSHSGFIKVTDPDWASYARD